MELFMLEIPRSSAGESIEAFFSPTYTGEPPGPFVKPHILTAVIDKDGHIAAGANTLAGPYTARYGEGMAINQWLILRERNWDRLNPADVPEMLLMNATVIDLKQRGNIAYWYHTEVNAMFFKDMKDSVLQRQKKLGFNLAPQTKRALGLAVILVLAVLLVLIFLGYIHV